MDESMQSTMSGSFRPTRHTKIFVESRYDATLYGMLCGEPAVSGIEFAIPHVEKSTAKGSDNNQGGFRSVRDACRAARAAAQPGDVVFGLLDGEEAARFGRGCELFESPGLVFSMEDQAADGLLFLGCYEKENLYLRHGDALGIMRSRFRAGLRIGEKETTRIEIAAAFDASIKASIVKYAAKALISVCRPRFDQEDINDVEDRVFRALRKNLFGSLNSTAMLVDAVDAWANPKLADEFIRRMSVLAGLCGVDLSAPARLQLSNMSLLSLCDGAALLTLVLKHDLKYVYEDMADDLLEVDFGVRLRAALLVAIQGRAEHMAPAKREDEFNKREELAFRMMDRWRF